MARTPRYNEGEQILTGQARSEQIANPGRGVSLESLGAAIEPALLDARGAAAAGRGYAALGQGIAQVGQPFIELAEQQAKMINANRVMEARKLMATAEAEFEAERINEGDETKWTDLAVTKASKVREALSGFNVSQAAADEIDSVYDGWKTGLHGKTLVASAQKSRRDFTSNLDGAWKAAAARGDRNEMHRITNLKKESGITTEGEAQFEYEEAERAVETAQQKREADILKIEKNKVAALAGSASKEDVDSYVDALPDVDESSRVALKEYGGRINNDARTDLYNNVVDGVLSGDIWNEYELNATYGNSPFMTPTLKRRILSDIQSTEKQKARAAAAAERDGPKGWENFTKLYMLANEWQPKQGTEEAAQEFMEFMQAAKISTPAGYSGAITDIIRSKFGASDQKSDARPEVQKMVTKRLTETFEQDLTSAKALRDTAKARLEKSPDSDKPKTALEEANKAYNEKFNTAIQEQARIERLMHDFYKQNPDASEEKVLQHLNGLMSGGKVIMRAESLWGSGQILNPVENPTAPPERPRGTMRERIRQVEPNLPYIDPSGIVNDMPDDETSRGPSSSLIPNFYNP